ncbi:ataxin-10 [Augochlora pura]
MNTSNNGLLPELESAFAEQQWDKLLSLLNPKLFVTLQSQDDLRQVIAFPIVAKTAEILTRKDLYIPDNVKIACLKCLGNTCFNTYKHREYKSTDIQPGTCCYELYSSLVSLKHVETVNSYPFHSHFPYEGVIEWTADFIKSCKINDDTTDEQVEILRLCIQFLCNLFSFAYKDKNTLEKHNIPKFLCDSTLKDVIRNLTRSKHISLVKASCIFIHNALKGFQDQIFTKREKILLCSQLLEPVNEDFESAREALMYLISQADVLKDAYNDFSIEDRLFLLRKIYFEMLHYKSCCMDELDFTEDMFLFLSERFCKITDLILKTADPCLDDMEPRESCELLNVLGIATSISYIKDNRSLFINCIYLLKTIQEIGKISNNYFTPMMKLSDVAQMMQDSNIDELEEDTTTVKLEKNENKEAKQMRNLKSHPAFAFKSALIRVIGNLVHKNKEFQDLLREKDVIPLLLDCCNIDVKNPMIMEWSIMALRNLCEGNPENQKIIRNCSRIGVVENSVLQEMGLTLHEDETGRQVGVVPLARHE